MARKLIKKSSQIKKIVKRPTSAPLPPVRVASATGTTQAAWTVPAGAYTEGIGRRKVATARVRLYHQPGDFMVNGQPVGRYFQMVPNAHFFFNRPLEITDLQGKFTISARVSGSGARAQLTAVVHGLARALVEFNPDTKPLLKQQGLLTRDDRMKETRKIGMGGKARRSRQSPKR